MSPIRVRHTSCFRRLPVPFRSECGFGVPVLLIAIGVVLAAAAAGAGYALKVRADLRKQVVFSAREIFIQKVKGHITNELGWNRTLADPNNVTTFACLNTPGANCCGVINSEFGLYDQSGNAVYDGRGGAGLGFNYAGQPCTTFSESSGDPTCSFRATLMWSGVNTGTDPLCRNAEIRIEMKHKDPNVVVPFNSKAEVGGNVFVRSKEEGFLVSHCTALGGAFDQKTNECTLRSAGGVCPGGQFLTGIDAQGNLICAAAAGITSGTGACPEGTAVRNLAVAGGAATPACVPFPSLPPCLTDYHFEDPYCYYDYRGPCTASGGSGRLKWNGSSYPCRVEACSTGYQLYNGACWQIQAISVYAQGIFPPGGPIVSWCTHGSLQNNGSDCGCPASQHWTGLASGCVNNTRACTHTCGPTTGAPGAAREGSQDWNGSAWGDCNPSAPCPPPTCPAGQHFEGPTCVSNTRTCTTESRGWVCWDGVVYSGTETWSGTSWGGCNAECLADPYGGPGYGPE